MSLGWSKNRGSGSKDGYHQWNLGISGVVLVVEFRVGFRRGRVFGSVHSVLRWKEEEEKRKDGGVAVAAEVEAAGCIP
jgi:hypothetical protein